jgi:mitotic spindle assembly checkpoint protein MAD2
MPALSNLRCSCADWLVTGALQKMVLVVTSVASKEVLERWTFDIQTDRELLAGGCACPPMTSRLSVSFHKWLQSHWWCTRKPAPEKSESEITSEIQAIIRQVGTGIAAAALMTGVWHACMHACRGTAEICSCCARRSRRA